MTCDTKAKIKLDRLMRRYLHIPNDVPLTNDTRIASLGAAKWRVIDLGIAVAAEFNVDLTADKALELEFVGDWRSLVTEGALENSQIEEKKKDHDDRKKQG